MKYYLIKNKIEEILDHYIPYRDITDSKEALEVRKVLIELFNFIEKLEKEKGE